MASLERDANRVPVAGGVTDDANLTPTAFRVDPATKRLKVAATTTISSATITDIEDGDGDSIMDTVNDAMQVNLVASSGTMTVDATDLDIRDLTEASDGVEIYGSDDGGTTQRVIKTDAGGAVQVDIESELPVGSNNIGDVDIASSVALDVSAATVTVDSTDLDIRDLDSASDSVTAEHGITGIAHGSKTVTTAGTDEALVGSSTPCKIVTIQAFFDNVGYISVGASGTDASAGGAGIRLGAGDAFEFEIDDLQDIYIDSTEDGEGVRFVYRS